MDYSMVCDPSILPYPMDEDDVVNQAISFGHVIGVKRSLFENESSSDIDNMFQLEKRVKREASSDYEDESMDSKPMLLEEDELSGGSNAIGQVAIHDGLGFQEDEILEEPNTILIHHMDIRDPLSSIRKALEEGHNINLDGYDFYLQDATKLEGDKNLVEQCVQGSGTVQINLELKSEPDGTKKINILDVLKPSNSYLMATGNPEFNPDGPEEVSQPAIEVMESVPEVMEKDDSLWQIDPVFQAIREKNDIPDDPRHWTNAHVRHWLLWAVRQFKLNGIRLIDWNINGATLCGITLEQFKRKVPSDPGDLFWTHLELLRTIQIVAVNPKVNDVKATVEKSPIKVSAEKTCWQPKENRVYAIKKSPIPVVDYYAEVPVPMPTYRTDVTPKVNDVKATVEKPPITVSPEKTCWQPKEKRVYAMKKSPTPVNDYYGEVPVPMPTFKTGNNGQVQLWQFLLDLLTDKRHRSAIHWLGDQGEFKLTDPERVAQLWGQRKNKPNMNYEKLSRALRYYYDGDMIAKVSGKRFVYKYVCDLKMLLGFSAKELNEHVIEAEKRARRRSQEVLKHSIFDLDDHI